MTIRHVIDYYMDGHSMIAFCKVCSAEGDKLIDDCPGHFLGPVYDWRRINGEPFEYAIQKGQFGDEFVKLADGSCLRRKIQK